MPDRNDVPKHLLKIIDHVWKKRELFICWPERPLLLIPGRIRTKFHDYSPEVVEQLNAAGIRPNRLSNGPAICAYLLAGGQRPVRSYLQHSWSVHHIYDGKHPFVPGRATVHAVKDGQYFTESAGLVAIHPVADSLADEIPYFAWLLRRAAYEKFGFDPDGVFGS